MKRRQGSRPEQVKTLAEEALGLLFKRRCGQAVIAFSVSELIRKVPCGSGINNEGMISAVRSMKLRGLIKVHQYSAESTDPSIPVGAYRIKLTKRGRNYLDLD